jgi:hypothetical protein
MSDKKEGPTVGGTILRGIAFGVGLAIGGPIGVALAAVAVGGGDD